MCERADSVGVLSEAAGQREVRGVQVLPGLLAVHLQHGGRDDDLLAVNVVRTAAEPKQGEQTGLHGGVRPLIGEQAGLGEGEHSEHHQQPAHGRSHTCNMSKLLNMLYLSVVQLYQRDDKVDIAEEETLSWHQQILYALHNGALLV